jgi:hypothetical protein
MKTDIKWNDLIESIMTNNKGMASINFLYEQTPNYRDLPSGDWQKTLRGVLYRDVKRGRFKKIGLGVYALSSYNDENSAYSYALQNKTGQDYLKKIKDDHSAIEGMLIEIGNFFEYKTYTSDINKSFDGKRLKELTEIKLFPNFTYQELKNIVSKSDVIWFSNSQLPFPKYIFEVESSTNFTNSMLKMFQMMDFETRFILLAREARRNIFLSRLQREPFSGVQEKFSFRSFEEVTKLYFSSVEHYEMKSRFLI